MSLRAPDVVTMAKRFDTEEQKEVVTCRIN